MRTLEDFMREHPVKPNKCYRPQARDWFGEIKQYLYKVRDGERRVDALRRRAELLDGIADPDVELTVYRDEIHKKLINAEQDMKRVRVEVMEVIARLPSITQQKVITKRYVDSQSWEQTAVEMGMSVRDLQMLHGRALPKLKRVLESRALDGRVQGRALENRAQEENKGG